MSASPLTSELKIVLAMVAFLLGLAFASMVPKNGPNEPDTVLGDMLLPEGGVSGLDGNGRFGFLPIQTKKLPVQRIAAVLSGYHPAERGENNDIAVYSGPGAKTVPLFVNPENSAAANMPESLSYSDFWSGQYAAASSNADAGNNSSAAEEVSASPQTGEDSSESILPQQAASLGLAALSGQSAQAGPAAQSGPKTAADSEHLMATAQREGNASGTIFMPDSNTPPTQFSLNSDFGNNGDNSGQKAVLMDQFEGPDPPQWQKELEVRPIDTPPLADVKMPEWNDAVSIAGSPAGGSAKNGTAEKTTADRSSAGDKLAEKSDDPLKMKALEAERSGLLAKEEKPIPTLAPLPESGDELVDNPDADKQNAENPKKDPIKSMEYNQTAEDQGAGKPVNILIPEDESKYAGRRTGQLIVASNSNPPVPARLNPASNGDGGIKVSVQMPSSSDNNQIAPPQPVSAYIADGSETLDSVAEQQNLTGTDREYFLTLNREKTRADGTIPAGTILRVPVVK